MQGRTPPQGGFFMPGCRRSSASLRSVAMPTSFIVVDDFLSPADAQGLRQAALGLTYPVQEGAFPGRNSQQRLELDGLSGAVAAGQRTAAASQPTAVARQVPPDLAGDTGRAKVHADHSHWSGILYLSAPEHCEAAPSSSATAAPAPSAWPGCSGAGRIGLCQRRRHAS
jgi:hypothetical protein